MSAGEVSQSVCSWGFISESEDEAGKDTEGWSEHKESESVSVVWDGMSPGDCFTESVEKYSEEAKNDSVESTDSACNGHVSNKHG